MSQEAIAYKGKVIRVNGGNSALPFYIGIDGKLYQRYYGEEEEEEETEENE